MAADAAAVVEEEEATAAAAITGSLLLALPFSADLRLMPFLVSKRSEL